jgi:hypothetical protein
MWTLCLENADEAQRPSHVIEKTTVTVLLNGIGMHMIDILPQNQKMNAEYFATNIVTSLASVCHLNGKRLWERQCIVHLGNTPIHNAKVVTDKLEEENTKRTPYLAYSHDASPCGFFLFGCLKDKLIDRRYATPEEPSSKVDTIISEIPSDLISGVFHTWQERL